MFVTFEGPEGSGKSTQIRLLGESLRRQGHTVVLTREPGGTPIGDDIRKILLDSANRDMVPLCEVLLYWAGRAQHLEELIHPRLKSGAIVLCDRYVDSTLAYQGFGRGLDFTMLKDLERITTGGFRPDKTFLLDLPVADGLRRARQRMDGQTTGAREDRFENEELAFHDRVRQGFLELARREPGRYVIVDALAPVADLQREIAGHMTRWLQERGEQTVR